MEKFIEWSRVISKDTEYNKGIFDTINWLSNNEFINCDKYKCPAENSCTTGCCVTSIFEVIQKLQTLKGDWGNNYGIGGIVKRLREILLELRDRQDFRDIKEVDDLINEALEILEGNYDRI